MCDQCALPENGADKDQSICPTCGEKGMEIQALTIRSLTRRDWPHYSEISDGFLCTNREDTTVYYFLSLPHIIDKKDLVDRIGIKESEEPMYVCYCFRHTREDIESDYLRHGKSTIEDEIREEVNNQHCSCEVTNPKGRCCLGDVRKTYLSVSEESVGA